MRSVNEVARQMFAGLHHDCHGCDEGCCCDCYVAGIMPAVVKALVERDAEVRAETLTGFEWEERGEVGACTHPHHVHGVTGVPAWSSSECHHKFDADARRLVGPWEPTT